MAGVAQSRIREQWRSASVPWVLHGTGILGNLTERWIDVQARSKSRFDSRLLGLSVSPGAEHRPHWLVCDERLDLRLAYRGMFKSAGVSPIWLASVLRENPPAVLHAHYGIYGSQLRHLARILRCGLIGSFYGYDASLDRYVKSRFWRRRYRRLFDECRAIVVEGPAMAERVAGLGCPEDKLDVIRLPADSDGLMEIERAPTNTFLVVAPGWASEKKGFDTAIRAFAKALRGKDARLLMLGGGPLEPDLRRLANDVHIEDQVEWGGALEFRSFMTRIGTGTVAVFPSRLAHDGNSDGGAPVTLIETQWLRVPVLVSDHDDLPFVAAPGGSMVLPPRDVDAWAAALTALYDAPEKLRPMGAAAGEFVRRVHSISENVRCRELAYARACGSLSASSQLASTRELARP